MKAWAPLAAALIIAGVIVVAANRRADWSALAAPSVVPLDDGDAEQGQGAGALDAVLSTLDPLSYFPTMQTESTEVANVAAFLAVIRKAEGTAGERGYQTMFGYRYFSDMSDHPRQPAKFFDRASGRYLWTSAAGAYQFMAVSPIPGGGSTRVDTWDRIKRKLDLPDFSPASQDAAALALIDEKGALNDVKAGRFATAIAKVRSVWASLPGAGYGQPERTLADLQSTYINAGGTLAA